MRMSFASTENAFVDVWDGVLNDDACLSIAVPFLASYGAYGVYDDDSYGDAYACAVV